VADTPPTDPAGYPLPYNYVRPFLFEQLHVRGALVRLREVWQAMQAGRDYPPPVCRLLGEMSAITALIAASLKRPGRMTFQLKGQGPVSLMVLDCDERLRLRGMARCDPQVAEAAAPALLGHGQLAFTLDLPASNTPYQSLVPLAGDSLAAIFEHFLERSEQLPTRLFLAATAEAAAGMFLQKMPETADGVEVGLDADADAWNRVQILAGTVKAEELTDLSALALLHRLFAEEDIRLFDPRPVCYHCPEDRDKVAGMLRGLGREECAAVLRERGEIHIHDEICNRDYRFDADMVATLFADRPAD
jgi:molecular chaperone Hsp33